MASRRAAFAPLSVFRTSTDFDFVLDSSSLQAGQRLANPGFPGFNSNSSEQTAQTLIGNPIQILCYNFPTRCHSDRRAKARNGEISMTEALDM